MCIRDRANLIMPMNQSLLNPKNHTILALHLKRMGGWVRDQVVYVDPTYQQVDMASPVSFRIFTHSELMATGHYALEDSTGRQEMFCNWKQVLQRLAQQVLSPSEKAFFFPIAEGKARALWAAVTGDSPTNVTLAGTTAVLPVAAVVP